MPEFQQETSPSETALLIRRLLLELSGNELTNSDRISASTAETYNNLRRLVEDAMDRYSITFRGICNRLSDGQHVDDMEALRGIGRTLFNRGCNTWGRVISLTSLVCCVMKMRQKSRPGESREIPTNMASFLARYLDEEFEPEMKKLGGWATLQRDLPNPNLTETRVKKWLLGSVIVFGTASLKALMIDSY